MQKNGKILSVKLARPVIRGRLLIQTNRNPVDVNSSEYGTYKRAVKYICVFMMNVINYCIMIVVAATA